ncbi:MAG TPA: DUF748 domain-containing protein [Steroidobacteraceae bacterium]|jgi:uncharacterized protein YhdP
MRRRIQILWAVTILVVMLIAIRAALPSLVRNEVNRRLHGLKAYDGHVEEVDLALWRGAYRVRDIRIVKRGAQHATPFFSGERVDFSVEWHSLLHGSLVAEGEFHQPNLNLIQSKDESQSQTGKEENWADRLEEFFPFRFNTVTVDDGTITFRAPAIRTEDAIKATHVNGQITNMTNVVESGKETFAGFRATASVLKSGSAWVEGSANPLAAQPTFDVNLEVKDVQLPEVNPWLRQYIKADAESGEFELYTELAAADGKFKGYAKPILRDVNISSSNEEDRNALQKIWEGIVEFAAKVLENKETEQVAARIPFSGTIKDPHANIFATIASVLHNAFISSFARSLEGSISIRDVKKNLGKIGDNESKHSDKTKKGDESRDEDKKPGSRSNKAPMQPET